MRPGRIDRILYVGLPDCASREAIFAVHLSRTPHGSDTSAQTLAAAADNYSGAEIAAVCREASLNALREDIHCESVQQQHYEAAMLSVRPRTSKALLKSFDAFQQSCGVESI